MRVLSLADFEVQSFSTFTITWSGNRSTYFQVTVHYVDESGKEISRPTSNSKISNGDTVTFADKAATISGYTYQGAHYDTYSGDVVTKMTEYLLKDTMLSKTCQRRLQRNG